MIAGSHSSKIKLKDINKSALILPYLVTAVWLSSIVGLFLLKNLVAQIFLGIIAVVGFILFVTRGKNLRSIKIGENWFEILFFPNKKTK